MYSKKKNQVPINSLLPAKIFFSIYNKLQDIYCKIIYKYRIWFKKFKFQILIINRLIVTRVARLHLLAKNLYIIKESIIAYKCVEIKW